MRAFVVAGLAFGDEGKGVTTDWLVRQHRAPLVVRYNGGPQAAHNVVTPDGRHHTFAQFGAGTLAGARTYLSRFMLVEPCALFNEARALAGKIPHDPFGEICASPKCTVITPYHILANRMKEKYRRQNTATSGGPHGSVGLGVGEARGDELMDLALTLGELRDKAKTISKLEMIRDLKNLDLRSFCGQQLPIAPSPDVVWDLYQECRASQIPLAEFDEVVEGLRAIDTTVVFEGAQGVLLDERYGFAPYNTWTDCTYNNAEHMIRMTGDWDAVTRVGVVRSYYTRHGAGPFPTEVENHPARRLERHNGLHPWMGEFRCGHFDAVLLDYALTVTGRKTDALVLTNRDRILHPKGKTPAATRYERWAVPTAEFMFGAQPVYDEIGNFPAWLEERAKVPLHAVFYGPTATDCRLRVPERW